MKVLGFCAVLLLAAGVPLAAGDFYHPDSSAAAGSLTSFPWNSAEARYHTLFPATALGGKPCLITDFAFATGAASTFTATQCEITLAHLSTSGTLSTIFATNLQKDATVVFSGPMTWPCGLDQWSPLGFKGTFPYNGVDQIVVEVRFTGGAGGVSCRSGNVLYRMASGAGAYSTLYASLLVSRAAPKIRLTYSETVLALSGSPTPGGTVDLDLLSTADAGLGYQLGSSFGTGPIPIDTRSLNLSLDALLVLSVGGNLPAVFQNYAGLLDAQGQAKAKLAIPNLPILKGVRIHTAFVTLLATAPSGVAHISNTATFTIL
ncbi:MAG: hypothetical protein JXQ29_13990 [Planctomycetes bacterium]|nr:hypothetical protein [Planctomycetota bacterium]